MHVYHFRFYWPSNSVFVVTCMTYVFKFEDDRTKLRSLSWTIGIADRHTDRQTDIHSSDFISVQCHALHWTDNKLSKQASNWDQRHSDVLSRLTRVVRSVKLSRVIRQFTVTALATYSRTSMADRTLFTSLDCVAVNLTWSKYFTDVALSRRLYDYRSHPVCRLLIRSVTYCQGWARDVKAQDRDEMFVGRETYEPCVKIHVVVIALAT